MVSKVKENELQRTEYYFQRLEFWDNELKIPGSKWPFYAKEVFKKAQEDVKKYEKDVV